MISAAKIAKRREKLGLSQAEAAAKAGFTRQRWNDIESGRKLNLEMGTLERVAAALGCKAKDLLE
jgi:transcriptional regulator with XRE-family HTH domain